MNNEMQVMKKQVKENISALVANSKLQEAQQMLNQYADIAKDDIEVFSIQAVIAIHAGKLAEAQSALETGLKKEKDNFDLLYNLAYVFEVQQKITKASVIYRQLTEKVYTKQQQEFAQEALKRLQEFFPQVETIKRRMVFFVKAGMDSFLDEIIEGVADVWETKKIIVTDNIQIEEGMEWADVCWFEWCDELVIYGSGLAIAKEKKVICRLHSYETFTGYPGQVNWKAVNTVIFVAEHIRDAVLEAAPGLSKEKTVIIPNGIMLDKYDFRQRTSGFKIAFLGYINYKKGPMLLLHTFKAIHDKDSRYRLHIAGTFQDGRDVLYFRQMIAELGLDNSVSYEGWQDDVNAWLDDKDYIICTSVLEGHPVGIMEGMVKGIKPLIHNFVGARKIFPQEYIWNTIDECIKQISSTTYSSSVYRQVIQEKYSKQQQIEKIINAINENEIDSNKTAGKSGNEDRTSLIEDGPLVTVGVINYNQEKYLKECLDSILNQNYRNIEILIIDDCSIDNSVAMINRYLGKYENIRLIRHESHSGNEAKGQQEIQAKAQGKYFTYINAKDYYPETDVISYYVARMEENEEIDFVYGNFKNVNQAGTFADCCKYREFAVNEVVHDAFNKMGIGIIPMIGLYKKQFFTKNKVVFAYDEKLKSGFNTLNLLKNLKYNWQYVYIDKDCLCCRQDGKDSEILADSVYGIITIAEYITRNFSEAVYLPEINWKEVKDKKFKKAIKAYYLGTYFYQVFQQLISINTPVSGDFDGQQLIKVLQPIEEKIEQYFAKSVRADSIFAKEIIKTKEDFKQIKQTVANAHSMSLAEKVYLPKVSVVIPTYNRREFLEQALESVLAQDYVNLEVVVSDNASTDGTDEMMEDFLLDKRVKYNRNEQYIDRMENHRHALYNLAMGEYALILSDDDYLIDDSYISKAVTLLLENPNVVLVHANYKLLNMDTNQSIITDLKTDRITKGLDYFIRYKQSAYGNICRSLTCLFNRKKAIEICCLQEESSKYDLFLNLKMMLSGDIGLIDGCVAVCRIHEGRNSDKSENDDDGGLISELEKVEELALVKGVSPQIVRDKIIAIRKMLNSDSDGENNVVQQGPLVTIGITNYNAKKYVEECLKSILEQTYKNIEILVIDDKSTDKSLDIVYQYTKRHSNMKLIKHMKNSGSPDLGRQEIIADAKGQYFMLFDSDDFFADRQAVAKFVEMAEKNTESDYIYCNLLVVNEQSEPKEVWKGNQYDTDRIIHDTFRRGGSGILNMKGLFKTEFFHKNKVEYLSNGTAGDTLTLLSCMNKGMNILHVDQALIAYRQHANNFTFDMEKRVSSVLNIMEYIISNFDKKIYFPELNWNQLNDSENQRHHAFLVAKFYYGVFTQYYSGKGMPWGDNSLNDNQKILEYLMPLKNKIIQYIQKGEGLSTLYNEELNDILREFNKIYGDYYKLLEII